MDIFNILETFGVPVAMSVAFGFFIWKQNKFIQDTLMQELDESFGRLEAIIIKLIDAQKVALMELKATKAMLDTMIKINEANKKVVKSVERRLIEVGSMDWMIKNLIFDIQMLKNKVEKLEGEKEMSDFKEKLGKALDVMKDKKPEVIKFINKKVNVPILNEKQEAKLLSQIFDRFMIAMDKFTDK